MKVLLAIQSIDLRLALELFLREQPGMTVVGTSTSSEGVLALLKTLEIDLIIMAWDLPELPSVAILAEAHTLPHPPRFLILGKCGEDEHAAVLAGVDRFVLVGDPPRALFDAINSLQTRVIDGVDNQC
jgi:DNA-binding NarL/FixJ family response regulator